MAQSFHIENGEYVIADTLPPTPFEWLKLAALPLFGLSLIVVFVVGALSVPRPIHKVIAPVILALDDKALSNSKPGFIGTIEIGAYSPEAATYAGVESLSITHLVDDKAYRLYRGGIRKLYGRDLAEANYYEAGDKDWKKRVSVLQKWIAQAARFGEPTVGLEPAGADPYADFQDNDEMRALREMFKAFQAKGINVRVRFASEANLWNSPYSATKKRTGREKYRAAARWFRNYMPRNAKMIFSPLLNSPVIDSFNRQPRGLEKTVAMYEAGVYDFIGGTLYADPRHSLSEMYARYVASMRTVDPRTPLQIDELGGPMTSKADVIAFLSDAKLGKFDHLQRINLFAGPVNQGREGLLGPHGFAGALDSKAYLHDLIAGQSG